MRTGLYTYGAHYLTSLTKTAPDIALILDDWDFQRIIRTETEGWVKDACGNQTCLSEIISEIQNQEPNITSLKHTDRGMKRYKYSLSQRCEWHESVRVQELMSETEKLHLKAHSHSWPTWVRCLPLAWERWNLNPAEWKAALRRRLNVDVVPVERVSRFCKWHRCDKKEIMLRLVEGAHREC